MRSCILWVALLLLLVLVPCALNSEVILSDEQWEQFKNEYNVLKNYYITTTALTEEREQEYEKRQSALQKKVNELEELKSALQRKEKALEARENDLTQRELSQKKREEQLNALTSLSEQLKKEVKQLRTGLKFSGLGNIAQLLLNLYLAFR